MKPYQPKILLIDIENAPILGHAWGVREVDILKVERHSYLLSFAYQWFPSNKIQVLSLRKFPDYDPHAHDDLKLMQELWKLLDAADVVVGQNSDRFDIKHINTRFLFHRMPIPSPYTTVDTLKINRALFNHPSNKLDEVCQYHGIGRKLPHTGKEMWFECMAGEERAWRLMERYNGHDIYLLRKLYDLIRAWAKPSQHTNLNLLTGQRACPVCQSTLLEARGTRRTISTTLQRYQCLNCGRWSSGPAERAAKIELR